MQVRQQANEHPGNGADTMNVGETQLKRIPVYSCARIQVTFSLIATVSAFIVTRDSGPVMRRSVGYVNGVQPLCVRMAPLVTNVSFSVHSSTWAGFTHGVAIAVHTTNM